MSVIHSSRVIGMGSAHLLDSLAAAARMITGSGNGRKQTMVAVHHGAQIEWEDQA